MSEIDNTKRRMPVILKKENEVNWLQGDDYKKYALPYSCELTGRLMNDSNQTDLFF